MMEIIKVISSILTPLIILIFGILININLDKFKSSLSKENEWQSWWSIKFLETSHSFNLCITNIVTVMKQLQQIQTEKLPEWEKEFKEKENHLHQNIRKIQELEWEIQNYTQFAKINGKLVENNKTELFSLIKDLINKKFGDLEKIRIKQFEFNRNVRSAHAEILNLKNDKIKI